MGRFEAKRGVIVRDMDSLTIIFKDRESVWISPKDASTNIVFHRWFEPKGSYSDGWQDFRRALWRNRRLNIPTCYRLAAKYHIQSMGTARAPTIKQGQRIKLIYERKKG